MELFKYLCNNKKQHKEENGWKILKTNFQKVVQINKIPISLLPQRQMSKTGKFLAPPKKKGPFTSILFTSNYSSIFFYLRTYIHT